MRNEALLDRRGRTLEIAAVEKRLRVFEAELLARRIRLPGGGKVGGAVLGLSRRDLNPAQQVEVRRRGVLVCGLLGEREPFLRLAGTERKRSRAAESVCVGARATR